MAAVETAAAAAAAAMAWGVLILLTVGDGAPLEAGGFRLLLLLLVLPWLTLCVEVGVLVEVVLETLFR